jgi:hypothetical protein
MVHLLSEELAQLMLMRGTIDTHPAPLLLILMHIHICLLIHMLNHAADLLEEQA